MVWWLLSVFSNPSVQAVALKCGTLQKLLTMLATPRPVSVKKKVILCWWDFFNAFSPLSLYMLLCKGILLLRPYDQVRHDSAVRTMIECDRLSMIPCLQPKASWDWLQMSANLTDQQYKKMARWCYDYVRHHSLNFQPTGHGFLNIHWPLD